MQALRAWRDTADVKPGATVSARLRATGYEKTTEHLARLARLELDGPGSNGAGAEAGEEVAATVPIPGGAVEIMAGDALDLEAASRRLEQRQATLREEIGRAERKLGNQGFVAKAPEAVVSAEREKLARLQAELDAL